jgi:hypothetical protein
MTSSTALTSPSLGNPQSGDWIVVMLNAGVLDSSVVIVDNSGLGTSFNKIQSRYDGNSGAAMYYAQLSGNTSGYTVSINASGGSNVGSFIVWWVSALSAYNSDEADSANFSGSSTAWAVGPTSVAPASGSLFLYCLATGENEGGTSQVSGYNVTGSHGFTATMDTNSRIDGSPGSIPNVWSGYIIASSAQTASTTLVSAGNWFGVLASFAASGSNQVTEDYWLAPAPALPDLSTWVFS